VTKGRLDDFLNFSLLPDLVRRHQVVGILTEKKQLVWQMPDAKSPNFGHEIMFRMAKTKIIPT